MEFLSTILDIKNAEELEKVASLELMEYVPSFTASISLNCPSYDDQFWKNLNIVIDKYLSAGKRVQFSIAVNNFQFTVGDMKILKEIDDKISANGGNLEFKEGEHGKYSMKDALSAFERTHDFIESVKNSDASPLEKFMMIYDYVQSFDYTQDRRDKFAGQNILDVLNTNEIVCLGFANLMNYICNQVGIECYNNLMMGDYGGFAEEGHAINIVKIKDEKYGVDGYYLTDACWGSNLNREQLNFVLYPLSDLHHISGVDSKSVDNEILFCDTSKETQVAMDNILKKDKNGAYDHCRSLGITNPFEACTELFENKELFSKLKADAANELAKKMKENGIESDVYSQQLEVPEFFMPEKLLAMLIAGEEYEPQVDEILKKLSLAYNGKIALSKKYKKDKFVKPRSKDIYDDLTKFPEDKSFAVFGNFVKDYLFAIEGEKRAIQKLMQIKSQAGEISIETFEKLITNVALLQGKSLDDAKKEANRLIKNSIGCVNDQFINGAKNCFFVEANSAKQKPQA